MNIGMFIRTISKNTKKLKNCILIKKYLMLHEVCFYSAIPLKIFFMKKEKAESRNIHIFYYSQYYTYLLVYKLNTTIFFKL